MRDIRPVATSAESLPTLRSYYERLLTPRLRLRRLRFSEVAIYPLIDCIRETPRAPVYAGSIFLFI